VQVRALWATIPLFLVIFACMLAFLYLSAQGKPLAPGRIVTIAIIFVLGLAMTAGAIWVAVKQRRKVGESFLGVSSRGLHLRVRPWHGLGDAVLRGPYGWNEVFFDGRRLFAGSWPVVVKPPIGHEVFGREQLEREVLARIPPSNFISTQRLGWKIMKAMSPVLKLIYVLTFVMMVVTFLR